MGHKMANECWVRVWAGQAASLMQYVGEKAVVYVAGEELEMDRATWTSLPPFQASFFC
jgi:hypothetical protein